MQSRKITDWQWSPPALGLALTQNRPPAATPPGADGPAFAGQVFRECVVPALAAKTATDFLQEVSRRLPLFAALHTKMLDALAATLDTSSDLQAIPRAYASLGQELRQWATRLDEVTRAELELAVSTLNRSNELLLKMIALEQTPPSAVVADLFRTSILVEFLLSCLWRLVELAEHPPKAAQIVYSLKYAILDHAAAVRKLAQPPEEGSPQASVSEKTPEATFWAAAGSLPLAELGDAA
jgi:hypothetical protein